MLIFDIFTSTNRRVLEASASFVSTEQAVILLGRCLTTVKDSVVNEISDHPILTPTAASTDGITSSV